MSFDERFDEQIFLQKYAHFKKNKTRSRQKNIETFKELGLQNEHLFNLFSVYNNVSEKAK